MGIPRDKLVSVTGADGKEYLVEKKQRKPKSNEGCYQFPEDRKVFFESD